MRIFIQLMNLCVSVCVCVSERERERERVSECVCVCVCVCTIAELRTEVPQPDSHSRCERVAERQVQHRQHSHSLRKQDNDRKYSRHKEYHATRL